MNSDAFMDRLKKAIDKESNRSFAEKCGLSEGTVRRYLKGEAFPPLDTLQVIADKSGCSLAWLASGEGEMRRGEASPGADHNEDVRAMEAADQAAPFAQDVESEELCRLLKRYGNRALVEDVKARLLKIKQVVEG